MSTLGKTLRSRAVDLTGQRFGMLTVVEKAATSVRGKIRWLCRCDCGGIKDVAPSMLKLGRVRSCGCYRRGPNWNRRGNLTHGQSAGYDPISGKRKQSVLYRTWSSMIQRCTNPRAQNFKWYGARGISVCERWMTFENFAADMGERPAGHSIDRIDNDGNYEPGNCRWATQREQVRNSRNCKTREVPNF